jgi:formate dehydrogenase major subunit
MTFHFPDQVATNELTVDAVDPQSGTSEFKAAAVRIEPVGKAVEVLEAVAAASVPV